MAKEVMIKVDGVAMPCPSQFEWSLQRVSAGESGRDDTGKMHVNQVTQKRKVKLVWLGKDWQTTSQILKAFNPQYIKVTYPDMLSGKYETRTFYTGDRTAPVKLWWTNNKLMEQIAFDIIER